MGELRLELLVALPATRVERPVREGLLDGAAGLRVVRAVGEAASPEELGDVVEGLLQPFVGDPEL